MIPPETGLLLALRRVRDGRVFTFESELLTDGGRTLPRPYVPYMDELFQNGHVRLDEATPGNPVRRALITESGLALLAELEASTKIPDPGRRRRFPTTPALAGSNNQTLETPAMPPSAPLIWLSVNLQSGGMTVTPGSPLLRRHGTVSMEWLQRFPELVCQLCPERPDIIFLQEALWFNHEGDELLHFVERMLLAESVGRYRGFLTLAHRSPHHQVVFINTDRLIAMHHWQGRDPDESSRRYGWVEVVVDRDLKRTLWLRSIHLDPQDGNLRLAEAVRMGGALEAGQRAIMAGDFNSITSRRTAEQGEPQRKFSAMPPDKRYGKGIWPSTKDDGDTDPDTRALDYLLDTGWKCQAITLNNTNPTTAPGYDRGGELIIDRCLTRGPLASHSMWVDTSDIPYSDHRALGGKVSIVVGSVAAGL